ncbi:hypothetical protein SAMN05444406_11943 [Caldicoprobacter faecalis]|uniref:Uncharacterized protein n=2 Tax=Caldicoprobacter faecalis TaxID=937334 RepID=A0A1I5WV16_9FIRM|nr:hypothetical protein SAMN05444406_11943 [Caldicoprobacter faecalis]
MTSKAKFYWNYAIYKGLSALLDDATYPIEILEELVNNYKQTIGISASELERKLELLKQKQSA